MTKNHSYSKPAHRFFLNPYEDCAFTKCPKCDTRTKLRKFYLVVHVEPNTFLTLGKTCRWCPYCDLIIGRKRELEPMMTSICGKRDLAVVGNHYLFIGTLERRAYRSGLAGNLTAGDAIPAIYPFKDVWHFQSNRPVWSRDDTMEDGN